MKLLIITQNDPFYLAKNLDYLIANKPDGTEFVGCIVSDVSPFGKKESFREKAIKTYKVFGLDFLIRYGVKFMINKFNPDTKVRRVINKYNIPLIELNQRINHSSSLSTIERLKPDLMISIAGNQIFKKKLLSIPSKGTINLHTALLPKYRGLMPSFWVLKNGEKETGVSVFMVDEGIDSGPIVVQRRVPINNNTQSELIAETKAIGMDCILEAIVKIRDNTVEYIPNDDAQQTYYSFPTRTDVIEFKQRGRKFY